MLDERATLKEKDGFIEYWRNAKTGRVEPFVRLGEDGVTDVYRNPGRGRRTIRTEALIILAALALFWGSFGLLLVWILVR